MNIFYCTSTHARTHTHTHDPEQSTAECPTVGQYNTNPQKEESLTHFTENWSCPEQDDPWFNPQHGQKIYIFSKTGSVQPPIQWAFFQG
jgi:hypothetical protein